MLQGKATSPPRPYFLPRLLRHPASAPRLAPLPTPLQEAPGITLHGLFVARAEAIMYGLLTRRMNKTQVRCIRAAISRCGN